MYHTHMCCVEVIKSYFCVSQTNQINLFLHQFFHQFSPSAFFPVSTDFGTDGKLKLMEKLMKKLIEKNKCEP
jgi:hypothetical protein